MDIFLRILCLNIIGATVFLLIQFEELTTYYIMKNKDRNIWESYGFILFLAVAITLFLGIVVIKPWTKYVVNNLSSDLVYGFDADTLISISRVDTVQRLSNSNETGARGDVFGGTVGPLIAWIAAVITFLAFWAQYRANKQQRNDIRLERFESRFFKFIDYHRENVAQMKYADPKRKDENQKDDRGNPVEYIEGNRVFRRITDEIRELLIEYRKKFDKQIDREAINIVYNAVFFGAGKQSLSLLNKKFASQEFNFGKFDTKSTEYNDSVRYYGGHARRLGHYFRNIYQAVKYVDDQPFLSEKQKYDYITILRAQMSIYEQEVFFYNSLSDLGEAWEYKNYKKGYPNGSEKKKVFKKLLVTKYDFIRNILNEAGEILIVDPEDAKYEVAIRIKDYYPLVNLERENEFKQVGILSFVDNNKKICRYCFNKKYISYYQGNTTEENEKLREEEYEKIYEAYVNGITDDFPCNEESCETKLAMKHRKL